MHGRNDDSGTPQGGDEMGDHCCGRWQQRRDRSDLPRVESSIPLKLS